MFKYCTNNCERGFHIIHQFTTYVSAHNYYEDTCCNSQRLKRCKTFITFKAAVDHIQ